VAQLDAASLVGQDASTREKILDVALELFTDQGFDGTSMREIASRLRISKPAIYYHFASKEEILLALHLRLHQFVRPAFDRLSGQALTLEIWGSMLEDLTEQMLAHRKIFLMHERNQAAMDKLHRTDHATEHDDVQELLGRALGDPALPLRDRVRMACSLGVVLGPLFMAGGAFDTIESAELGSLVRDAVRDVVRRNGTARHGTPCLCDGTDQRAWKSPAAAGRRLGRGLGCRLACRRGHGDCGAGRHHRLPRRHDGQQWRGADRGRRPE
jgi:AcrR family transcriptional regulator